jgi:SAM-dependent methyltransferase
MSRSSVSSLVEINGLVADEQGIYSHPDSRQREFGYSDGSAQERYLFGVLNGATDLGSASEELQSKIVDWPSEYHLSGKRANLLRPFQLPPGARVLELGCGCGAISRYLGECALEVDAIEGSGVRAALARLRCRDLESVNIICANFNLLELPAGEYDYVLLIGVVEYARRFSPGCDDDLTAVTRLLERVRASLKGSGRLLVAIENRTGMKYLHGAHEDHYSLRYVGIDGYHESAGIRTFTHDEWSEIATRTGYGSPEFFYPFPDYKIPEVLLSDHYVRTSENAWCHLEGITSEDYTFVFDPHIPETLVWQGYNAAGVLGRMANSFLLCLPRSHDAELFSSMEFAHLPDFRRKRQYLTTVTKARGEDVVHRIRHADGGETAERYLEGQLLCARWARDMLIHSQSRRLEARLREYLVFLDKYADEHGAIPLDLLPNNIILSAEGDFRVFDQEWSAVERADRDYVLFRALLTFATLYRPAIRGFCRRHGLFDVEAFIRAGFRLAGVDRLDFEDYCRREDAFQDQVLVLRGTSTAEVLATPLMENPVSVLVYPMLYWATESAAFQDGDRIGLRQPPSADPSTLRFELPREVAGIGRLRFDPCDENRPDDSGFLNIEGIRVLVAQVDGSGERVIWELVGQSLILGQATISQLVPLADDGLLAITGDDPSLVFAPGLKAVASGRFIVEIDWRFTFSREYRLARHHYLEREQALMRRIEDMRSRVEQARRAESDLARITSSRLWRCLSRARRLIAR